MAEKASDKGFKAIRNDNITTACPFTTSTSEFEAISRVLNIAELLENILSNVPVSELLHRGTLVCRGFKHAIASSPTIQRSMGVLLHHTSTKQDIFSTFQIKTFECQYTIRKSVDKHDLSDNIRLEMGLGGPGCTITDLAKYPQLCRMQVCQPIVEEMVMVFSCYCTNCNVYGPIADTRLKIGSGITFGDVFERALARFCVEGPLGGQCGGVESVDMECYVDGAEGQGGQALFADGRLEQPGTVIRYPG